MSKGLGYIARYDEKYNSHIDDLSRVFYYENFPDEGKFEELPADKYILHSRLIYYRILGGDKKLEFIDENFLYKDDNGIIRTRKVTP